MEVKVGDFYRLKLRISYESREMGANLISQKKINSGQHDFTQDLTRELYSYIKKNGFTSGKDDEFEFEDAGYIPVGTIVEKVESDMIDKIRRQHKFKIYGTDVNLRLDIVSFHSMDDILEPVTALEDAILRTNLDNIITIYNSF